MTKTEELLAYFDRLITLNKTEYICHKEIAEVIEALRGELGLSKTVIQIDGKALADSLSFHKARTGRL